ncbi:protein shisa-1-like [Apteryx mantelli]|uniref:Protein shisa-1-like n=1 Tax=Apteryx mantelli TaxID=2696672 RepID=A0ABM4F6G2_9AVES
MAGGLLVVLLLALRGSPGRAGEYCHGGAGSPQRGGFQCPERHDGPEAALCCGSCRLRYCCASSAARLDQGLCPGAPPQPGPRPPAPVPVYLPFLLVGSVFVAFVVCGICVGICCCKRLKAQDEEQQSALAPGQTWLLEPDLPSRLAASSSATRSSLGSGPQTSNICTNLAPSLPVTGFTEDALYLSALPASGRLLHPSCTGHGIPTAHTTGTPASFLKRPVYGHSANASPISVAREDQKMYLGVLRV